MKVFISSLISGIEPICAAARNAVTALGHQPIMAEGFGARPHSPQVACLDGVRQAGAVIYMKTGAWQRATRQGVGPVVEAKARISRLEGMEGPVRTADIRLKRFFPAETFDLPAAE
jgi:Domain of unknown function (DUF4062)